MRHSKRFKRKTGTAGLVNTEGEIFMAGEVCHFAGASAPVGWLVRNGAAVSRSTYAALFAVIGTMYGAGDGVNTFNLPDDRGSWDVGADLGKGFFPNLAVGQPLAEGVMNHTHSMRTPGGSIPSSAINMATVSNSSYWYGPQLSTGYNDSGTTHNTVNSRAYLPVIKY